MIQFEVGNTFEELADGKYKISKNGYHLKYKWTIFARMVGDKDHSKIEELVDKVHFGLWSRPYVEKKFDGKRGFFYDCIGYGTFNTPIELFWKTNVKS